MNSFRKLCINHQPQLISLVLLILLNLFILLIPSLLILLIINLKLVEIIWVTLFYRRYQLVEKITDIESLFYVQIIIELFCVAVRQSALSRDLNPVLVSLLG